MEQLHEKSVPSPNRGENWKWVLASILLLAGIGGFIAYSTYEASHYGEQLEKLARDTRNKIEWEKVTKTNYDKLKIGMFHGDVINLLSTGTLVEETSVHQIIEYPNGKGEKIVLTFINHDLAKKQWITK